MLSGTPCMIRFNFLSSLSLSSLSREETVDVIRETSGVTDMGGARSPGGKDD